MIYKATGSRNLFKHFAPWRAMFGVKFDMQPEFTDQEVCERDQELFQSMAA